MSLFTHLSLKSTREKLESQNKLREDVHRITRHDLKSPLNAIVGIPQILMMNDSLSKAQVEDLKLIEDAGYQMLEVINFSLDLFKMEQGN